MDARQEIRRERNPIQQILDTAMSKIKHLAEVETIIGDPVIVGGSTVVPISKVTVGLIAGGGEYGDNGKKQKTGDEFPFAGGSGAGVSVQPIGFLVSDHKGMRMVRIDNETAYEKLLALVPDLVSSLVKKDKKK